MNAGSFTFRYESKELKEQFDKYCEENPISKNKLLNKLLKEYLKKVVSNSEIDDE